MSFFQVLFRLKTAAAVIILATVILAVGTAALPAFGATGATRTISYQGRLTDATGASVADGAYNLKIAIYDAASGGNCIWSAANTDANTETTDCGSPGALSVTVIGSLFTINLGDTTTGQNSLSTAVFNDDSRYLGVTVNTDTEMTPRLRLTAAYQSLNSLLLNSLPTSAVGGATAFVPVTDSSGNLLITQSIIAGNSVTVGNTTLAGNGITSTTTLNIAVASGSGLVLTSGTSAVDLGVGTNKITNTDLGANLVLSANGNIKIDDGHTLIIGSLPADPLTAVNGSEYYNTVSNKRRCFTGGVWADCNSAGFSTVSGVASLVNPGDQVGIGTSTPVAGTKLQVVQSDAVNNDIANVMTFDHDTSGTAAAGIGIGTDYRTQNNLGITTDAGHFNAFLTDVTSGNETSAFSFETRTGGGPVAERMRITANGAMPALTNNAENVGGVGNQWRSAYLGTGLIVNANTTLADGSLSTSSGNLSLVPAGAGTGSVVIGGGSPSTTPDLLVVDSKSTGGDPAGTNGAMYYNTASNVFRCFVNGSWVNCDTTGGTATLQSVYNAGATITTGSATDIAFTLASGNFTASGTGSVNLTPTAASSFTSGGTLMLTGGAASTWGTSSGNLNLNAAGAATGNIQIGSGTPSATPDVLVMDVKTTAGDPAGTNGAMYYNGFTNKLRCFQAGIWVDCAGTAISTMSDALATNTLSNGDFNQTWNWSLTTPGNTGLAIGENLASTATGDPNLVNISTLASSTATPLRITNLGNGASFRVDDESSDVTPFLIDNSGNVAIGSDNFDPLNPEKLKVDGGTTTTINLIAAGGDINDFLQVNIRNRNSGNSASSDLVATADNGDQNSNYIDTGINSSGYSNPDFTINGPDDGYLYTNGGNLTVGTQTAGKALIFHTGGTLAANERMRIDGTGNVGINTATPGATLDVKGTLRLSGATSGFVGFAPAAAAGATTYTLPSADGSSGQALTTNGSGVLSWVLPSGVWQRVGTTLSPATAGDAVNTAGNISTSGTGTITAAGLLAANAGATITGATASINDNSNFNTTINTGTSTGTVTIGSPLAGAINIISGTGLTLTGGASSIAATGNIIFQPAGASTTANVQIGAGGAGSATPDLLALDVKSSAGDPAGTNGAMYYNANANVFRCFTNGSWVNCDTTGGTATLQSVYNAGATITTGSATDIAFTLTSGNFTASGAGSVNLTPTAASSFTSGGALTLTGGTASTWGTTAGDLTLQAAGPGTTANVKIGAGGAGSATPDLFAVDVKSNAGDPAGFNGAMYYSGNLNTFRCYVNGGWQNCGQTAASATTLEQAYTAGPTITTTGSDVALVLTSGNFTAAGAGGVILTPTAASSFTSGGSLTLTGGAASTWGTTAGNLSLQAAGAGTTANVQIGSGAASTTPDLLVVDLKSTAGDPAGTAGAMYYNNNLARFRCFEAGAWVDCGANAPSSTSLNDAYLNGGTITTAGTNPVALVLSSGDFNVSGAGAINLSSTVHLPNLSASSVVFTDASNNLVSGTVSVGQGGTGQTSKTAAFDALSPTTTKGDLIASNGANNIRLPIGGTNGTVLMVDSTQTAGMRWATNIPPNNSLDFAQFSDAMTVDANTSIAMANKNLTINDVAGAGALTLAPGGALTLTGGAASVWSTTAGNITLQAGSGTVSLGATNNLNAGGALSIAAGGSGALTLTSPVAATWGTSAGNLSLVAAGTGSGNVQIGSGAGTTTPDLFVVDLKSTAGDPTGTNGAIYYNSSANKFRCFTNGVWQDCPGTFTEVGAVNQMKNPADQLQIGSTAVPAGVKMDISLNDATNNASSTVLVLDHTTTGTAGNGIGANLLFRDQNDAGASVNAGDISGILDNVANGTEDSSLRFFTRAGGAALAERLRITSAGFLLPGTTDNALDIGTVANRWRTIRAGTSMVVGNATTYGDGSVSSTGALNLIANGGSAVTLSSSSGTVLFAAGTNQLQNTDNTDITIRALRNLKVDDASMLALSVKAADPAAPPATNGTTYYNSSTNKFRCYQNNAWTDCVTGGTLTGTGTSGQVSFWTGSTTQSGDTGLFWDNTAKALGIGTSTLNAGVKLETETTDGLTNGIANVAAFEHDTSGTAANGLGVGILLRGQNDSGAEFTAARIDGIMTNVATGSETSALALETYGAGALTERARLTSAGNLTFAQASTLATSTGALSVDSAAALNLGTTNATSLSISKTGATSTVNGALTVTQTLTGNGNISFASGNVTGASPLVFDGATADANKTTFAITDPTQANTITFPNATITVNAAGNISGTTLATNVVTSSLTTVGALASGSIASGFGTIATANTISTSSNISTTGTGTITSAGLLTASNGLTQTTGALNLTATSGALALSGLGASSLNTGANAWTVTSSNFNTTATGINSTAIGTTTASTGKFTTLTSTGATDLANAGASNVTIATTGTGTVAIGNSTGTFALTSSGGLNATTAGALTGVASVDTISHSATAITFAGAGTIDTTAAALSLGTSGATSVALGKTGIITTNNGALTVTQTLTANGNVTLTGANITGASPLVFDGATADANKTTFAITDPTQANTITFPNATITVNAASNISGTTLATNVVTSSLTTVGALASGSIASGFGTIATANTISTSNNISTTGTGTITSAGLLTASNGFTLTTGALNMTATSGALALSGLGASSLSTGANSWTVTSSNFNTTATGINGSAIGATTASTGKFTTLTSTGATDLANAGASNVTIATTGTGTVAIGNSTGTFALTSSGGLNATTAGALTGVASVDTISFSATAITAAGALTIDSGTTNNLNFGSGANAKTITLGNNSTTTALNITSGTGAQTFTSSVASGTTTTSAFVLNDAALTSGTLMRLNSTSTSGKIMDMNFTNTTGTIMNGAYGAATNQGTGALTGLAFDMNTNLTAPAAGQNVTGFDLKLPIASTTSNATVYAGFNISTAGAITNATAGSFTWKGTGVTMPNITQSSGGTVTSNGLAVTTGTITTGGTENGLNIAAAGVGAGSLNGLNISNITGGAGTETAINIGTGWDQGLTIGVTPSATTGRTIDVAGNWGGNAVTDSQTLQNQTTTVTESTKALAYFLTNTIGTNNNAATITFNITGLPATDGTFAFIESQAIKGAVGPQDTVIVQINGSQVSSVVTVGGAAQTVIKNYTVVRMNGTYRVIGGAGSADTADLAEWIPYSGDQPAAGELVSVDSSSPITVARTSVARDNNLLGVVSTQPNTIFGKDDGRSVLLTLAGRIPVKISNENGAIKAGDYLTSSSTPGMAMKATKPGMVIGQVLSATNGDDATEAVMLVKNTYYPGDEPELGLVLGDWVGQSDLTNGIAPFTLAIQNEAPHDPLSAIADKISGGFKSLTDFVAARVTAIRGYFDETFANKSHQKTLCVGDAANGDETCITKSELDQLLKNKNGALYAPSTPSANVPSPTEPDANVNAPAAPDAPAAVDQTPINAPATTPGSADTTTVAPDSTVAPVTAAPSAAAIPANPAPAPETPPASAAPVDPGPTTGQ